MNKFNIEVDFDDSDEKLSEEGLFYIKTNLDNRYIAYFYLNSFNKLFCKCLFKYEDLEWNPTTITTIPAKEVTVVHKRPVKEIKIKV